MSVSISAQVTISFDGTKVICEAPGTNGARRKVEGISFSDLPWEIRSELDAQLTKSREQQRNDLMTVQRNNVQYVAENHGTTVARRIWGSDWAESRTLRSRLAKTGQFDPNTGKIISEPKKTQDLNHAVAMDLDFDAIE